MRRSILAFGSFSFLALFILSAVPVYAVSSVVQTKTCAPGVCSVAGCTYGVCATLAFTSSVTDGDIVLIAMAQEGGSASTIVTDTLGTSFALAATKTANGGDSCSTGIGCTVYIYYGVAPSGGADTVSFEVTGTQYGMAIYELSGVQPGVVASSTGTFNCNYIFCAGYAKTSSSDSFSSYGFLVSAMVGACADSTNTAGETGYTELNTLGSGGYATSTEYSVSGVSSPTSYQQDMTCGPATDNGYGPIVGAEFALAPAAPSQTTTTSTSTVTATTTTTSSTVCTSTTTTTSTVTTTITITSTAQNLYYTVTTDPPGLASSINVDGTIYNSPATFYWSAGSVHTIQALSPCNLGHSPYTSFTFVRWSDGGSQTHSVTAPTNSTVYTAYFQTTATQASCGSPNPLQQLEKGCVVPALLAAWSAPIGLQPWLGFVLLGTNVAIYNKSQSVWMSIIVLWVTGATFFLFLPPYVGLVAQVFLYIGIAGIVVKGILRVI